MIRHSRKVTALQSAWGLVKEMVLDTGATPAAPVRTTMDEVMFRFRVERVWRIVISDYALRSPELVQHEMRALRRLMAKELRAIAEKLEAL